MPSLLYLDNTSKPVLKLPDNTLHPVPNNKLGAWLLRVHCKHLDATPDAEQWFIQNSLTYTPNPLFNYTLPPYQILGLNRMKIGNTALWLDMGLGKTVIVLAYCLDTYCLDRTKNIFLIICPVSVFGTWKDEIQKTYRSELQAQVLFAHGAKRNSILASLKANKPTTPVFIITSYDTTPLIRENLISCSPNILIFDEASEVRYLTANKTKTAHLLARTLNVPTFLLSGTPSTTTVEGYYSLYELLGKGNSGSDSLYQFKATYEEQAKFLILEVPGPNNKPRQAHVFADGLVKWLSRNYPPGSPVSYLDDGYSVQAQPHSPKHLKLIRTYNKQTGVKNIEQLNKITKFLAYSAKKEEVLPELPEKVYVKREITLPKEIREAYDSMIDANRAIINNTPFSFQNQNTPFCKLHQIANGFLMHDNTCEFFKAQPKLDELLHIINEAGEQKIVIWSPHLRQIAQIRDLLNKRTIKHGIITGSTSASDRIQIINTFQNDNSSKIFLANPEAAGLGTNLQIAHLEIYMSNWYKPDIRDQSEDRLHRKGQKNAVTVIDLVSVNTIESHILNSLRKKINLENQILTMKHLQGE
jgi:SNF2 family DNA or RNA helicase